MMCNKEKLLHLETVSINTKNKSVLKNINLSLCKGEIHTVIGEHGAGKTTLAKTICGLLKPSSGKILRQEKLNIELVSQNTPLFEELTVAENIILGSKIRNTVYLKEFGPIREATTFLEQYDIDIRPELKVKDLDISTQVLLDVMKHIYKKPNLLILDEMIHKLNNKGLQTLLRVLKGLTDNGVSLLILTHSIEIVHTFTTRVSILRDGEILYTDYIKNIDKITLLKFAYTQLLKESHKKSEHISFQNLVRFNEAIIRDLPINLVIVDKNKQIKMLNNHAIKRFNQEGYSSLDTPIDTFFPHMGKNAQELISKALSERKQTSLYHVSFFINNKKTINNIQLYPIFDDNSYIGHIILIEDITEQESLRHQLIVSEKLASVGLLAAGVAHEINNPLDIIGYYIQHIRFLTGSKEVRDALDNLEEEVENIAQIVSNLISFSDKRKEQNEYININTLISELIAIIEYNAKINNIRIRFTKEAEDVFIYANKIEIKQVILNLIKNSFEVMTEGGLIEITTSLLDHSSGNFSGSPSDRHEEIGTGTREENTPDGTTGQHGNRVTQIIYADNGPGIDESHIDDIFLPFFSKHSDQHTNNKNIGLGLSIVYGIIKKYNGEINIKNRYHGGCEFVMHLPAYSATYVQSG